MILRTTEKIHAVDLRLAYVERRLQAWLRRMAPGHPARRFLLALRRAVIRFREMLGRRAL